MKTDLTNPPIRRSMLFVPADRPDRIQKGASLDADTVVIDLEDAVAPSQKDEARKSARQSLDSIDFGYKEVILRINSVATMDGLKDILALAEFGRYPDSVVLPKVESAGEVRILAALLDEIDPRIQVMVVLESAAGILAAHQITAASPKVTAVLFGGADLSGDIGCPMTWEPLSGARHLTVLAATAARIDALDVPFLSIEDAEGLEQETRRAQEMGFTGKIVIHPKQIAMVNKVFSPSPEQLEWARQIMDKVREAGQGVIRVGGAMVDAAVVKRAQKIVQTAAQMAR